MGQGEYRRKVLTQLREQQQRERRERDEHIKTAAQKSGYSVMDTKEMYKYGDTVEANLDALIEYRTKMNDLSQTNTTISFLANRGKVGGFATPDGDITVYANHTANPEILVHEHTHNLVHSLIEKELGYAKGSPEYNKAVADCIIEKDVQEKALVRFHNMVKKETLKNATIKEAAEVSHMRKYALADSTNNAHYRWVPKGTYIELTSVASEIFHKVGYNWKKLQMTSPFSYCLLRELKHRITK